MRPEMLLFVFFKKHAHTITESDFEELVSNIEVEDVNVLCSVAVDPKKEKEYNLFLTRAYLRLCNEMAKVEKNLENETIRYNKVDPNDDDLSPGLLISLMKLRFMIFVISNEMSDSPYHQDAIELFDEPIKGLTYFDFVCYRSVVLFVVDQLAPAYRQVDNKKEAFLPSDPVLRETEAKVIYPRLVAETLCLYKLKTGISWRGTTQRRLNLVTNF